MRSRDSNKTRITKELKNIQNSPPALHSAWPTNSENIHSWTGAIVGPDNSPYKGGIFYIKISFPSTYPFQSPDIKFLTKIYHPNIRARGGTMCYISLMKNYSPTNSLNSILDSLQKLVETPDIKNCAEPEAGRLYKSDIVQFNRIASEWTRLHAS
ncbi:unnamed protein product [Blepharisma stoltei]|uniref:UBC core domain-containing protein n=1 Tax=Blepharisma stoltei TaxID=1481888 RepID=A0AAU9J232_9CILI|nr:unnamed protein product [Blepharisma stoltei]